METSDNGLLSRAKQGDRDALAHLLRRHGPNVRRTVSGKIPKRWRSMLCEDDVMQQTYADATAGISRFESTQETALEGWLKKIARRNLHHAVEGLETEKRGGKCRRVEPSDDSRSDLLDSLTRTRGTPGSYVSKTEALAALRAAIDELPAVYCQVVAMCDLESRPVAQVAETLGRKPGAIYMLRARAHDRLHEIMGRTTNFFGDSA